ncbi:MAG: 5-dehydro-2-deoxygluconokinase [Pseudomonadota bacterium]
MTALDLITLGRCGVDFYADQVGARLEDASRFSKYLGGSSTNIAACAARQGLRSGLITRVGDEHLGRFLREQLTREGVDTRCVRTDPSRPTAMVVLGIKDRDTFPLVFVRENCADMGLELSDLDPAFIGSAKCLLITGTHFSTERVHAVSTEALKIARARGVKTALDIDYRPVLWGLTSRGDGETRFIANDGVTAHLQGILPMLDLVIGTEEEVHIAGGSTDTLEALRAVRAVTDAIIVLKRGPFGATVFDGPIPDAIDDGITVSGVTVDVLNVLGAGDAFAAGFLRGWLNGEGYEAALTYANASGALVVSRHGCTPAMPTVPELAHYLAHAADIPRPDQDAALNQLHRVTTRVRRAPREQVVVLAFDHRAQFVEMCETAGVSTAHIPYLKRLLLQAAQAVVSEDGLQGQAGILCDDTFGQDVLNDASGRDWWIGRPVEVPHSRPIQLEGGSSIGSRLRHWPDEHIVKCLISYHPDDEPALRDRQEQQVLDLWAACQDSGHELLLEIIPPTGSGDVTDAVCRSVERFYGLGVFADWWKLPALSAAGYASVDALIAEHDPHCQGVVVLGLDAPIDELAAGFHASAGLERVKGFAVGRSIFGAPSRQWLANDMDDAGFVDAVAQNYRAVIAAWQKSRTSVVGAAV